MNQTDMKFLRASFQIARRARENGNHPFGALLVDEDGILVAEAENTVLTAHDTTAHAETNLMRLASSMYGSEFLTRCTVYTSTEPCPMCAGAIFWTDIKRVVFGLSERRLSVIAGREAEKTINIPCRTIFEKGNKIIEVVGPVLEDEAADVHRGFWE